MYVSIITINSQHQYVLNCVPYRTIRAFHRLMKISLGHTGLKKHFVVNTGLSLIKSPLDLH
jgi:hypothetical protein